MKSADPDVLMLAALADPNRLEIVRQLGLQAGLTCACDFTDCCAVSQPTVSHHLKVLRDAGVVVSERRGTNIYYSLAPGFADRFRSLGASIGGLVQIG
ncbi:MAG: metalloregulator ArsR/SmtB family transcription factor [Chloroflexota bacterium]|nr:metalloregulator ArsR/SmtB family transcription factor [Chloroflexota bacterium]